ncbi:10990_t:CDS:10 [Gigaspora rosea]|nr:10990_t:CDS:10 [Gigaspora rosea]
MDKIKILNENRALREYDYNKFNHVENIKYGGLHEIKKAYLEPIEINVTIKYLNEDDENKYHKKLLREVMNLKEINQNKNVVKFYGLTKESSKNYYSIVLQQCYGEDLRVYMKNNSSKMNWTFKIRIATDIANGLKYIHRANIVHHALNPKHILEHDGNFVIIGFSSSVFLEDSTPDLTEKISDSEEIYVDPVRSNVNYNNDKSSDIYSLGLILWEISSGKIPEKRSNEAPVNSTPIDYKELYESAWQEDPKIRPSIEEVIQTIDDIDINQIYQDSDYIPNVYLGNSNAPATKKEACLFIVIGTWQTQFLFLTQTYTFVGRNESNDIVIKDQEIGKRHAKIKSFQGKVEIFDLGSKFGIYVNERKLGFRASRTLEKDDKITLGKATLQYLPAGEYENQELKDIEEKLAKLLFEQKVLARKEAINIIGRLCFKRIVQTLIRPEDIFARYGGEEFTILLKNTKSKLAFENAEKLRKAIESHEFNYNGKPVIVTVSFGIADMNSSVESHEDLLKHADEALYDAKKQGRNRVIIWTNKNDSVDSVGKETVSDSKENDSNGKENDSNSEEISSNNYLEIFSKPTYFPTNKKTIQHDKLPSVTNELSVTFQLNLKRHNTNWISIFHKGEDAQYARTPALWLTPSYSQPYFACSVNSNWNINVTAAENKLELNKWYHIAYTLSEPQKRMELYVNSKLIGFKEIKEIKVNESPLKIGHSGTYADFQGEMSNFRYYNIRLSADEIFKDYISYLRNQVKVLTKEVDSNNYLEIFSGPTYFPTNKTTIQPNELLYVTNELSVMFQLNLEKHNSNWISIFLKGEDAQQARNPALWLTPNYSQPYPVCSVNGNWDKHITAETKIELNKWYHIAYTLSEPQKRMELYVDGELVGYTDAKDIIFNEFPLKIGHSDRFTDFQGQMRYYLLHLRLFRAKWIDGPRTKWNAEKEIWERYSNVNVALKCLKEENFNELFKESNNRVVGRFNTLRVYGITYNPELKAYMIVMTLADDGDLSVYLKKSFSSLTYTNKLEILYDIATGLTQIHESGLVHRDLHTKNVMCQGIKDRNLGRGEEFRFVIGDLGLAIPPKKDMLYVTIGTWLNQCLYAPNSEIAKEFKRGDELRLKEPRSQSDNDHCSTLNCTQGLKNLLSEKQ